jgi:hypothetical protein
MGRGRNTFQAYIKTFGVPLQTNGQASDSLQATADMLFDLYYHWCSYALPLLINSLLTIMASVVTLTWAGLDLAGVPGDIEIHIRSLPPVVFTALAGAYVWGLYDILSRYQSVDLSPVSLHFVWWRLLIAPVLGYLVSLPFTDSMKALIGFILGVFPARTLLDYLKGLAEKNIRIDADARPSQEPTLHKIQGMTKDMIESLSSEGILSAAHLAAADPIKLLLRTNIEWKLILDVIDQSILFNYLGDKLTSLRALGIRGAIELAVIDTRLESPYGEEQERSKAVVTQIASKLEEQETGIYNLIKALRQDVQVQFIWGLWQGAAPLEGDPDSDIVENLPKGLNAPEKEERGN